MVNNIGDTMKNTNTQDTNTQDTNKDSGKRTFVCFVCGDKEEVGQGGCYVDCRTGEQYFDRPICVPCNEQQNDDCYDDDY